MQNSLEPFKEKHTPEEKIKAKRLKHKSANSSVTLWAYISLRTSANASSSFKIQKLLDSRAFVSENLYILTKNSDRGRTANSNLCCNECFETENLPKIQAARCLAKAYILIRWGNA